MRRNRTPTPVLILGLTMLLSGCALGRSADQGTGVTASAAVKITGRVFGGQQPVTGSTIQLYTVGTTGIASASTPLISGTVLTDGGGNFSITGLYDCTNATQVYITASGGNSGAGNNASLSLLAALGSCATLKANALTTYININELTTVAGIYALAPFASGYTHIGATGSNPAGLVTAFTTATALVTTSNGQIPAPPAGITLPAIRLNTLADIIASCVNTTGAASNTCTTLFATTGASNTADAALFIAKNPGAPSVTALYSLSNAAAPFVPQLSAQPNDFTLAVTYSGTDLASPYGIALDAAGNAWVTNEAGTSVSKLSAPSPAFTSQSTAAGGLLSPRGVSIDRGGNVWIANTGANNVVKLSASGAVLSAAGFTSGGISAPVAIANDSAGNAFVANFTGNSVTELSATGTSTASLTTSISAPTGLALDAAGDLAVANAATGSACVFTHAGVLRFCPTDGTLFGSTGVALTPTGALAMSGSTTGSAVAGAFTLTDASGNVNAASPIPGGGLTIPTAVAFDAAGTAWFANAGSISAFNGASAITPANGLGSLNLPQGIAIDASGNVWTTNSGDNSVSIFIGLAAPTPTPIAVTVGP